ncbi:MAG: hypothetical protein JWO46_619 [Nocardioidaceae bacterium]|nr:hypothetical protein [Nocardioidaceae bacterium]
MRRVPSQHPDRTADPLAWLTSLEGVPSAFAATRDGIDALLRDRGLRRTDPGQTTESLLRGAHASALLAGSSATVEEVREGAGDDVARAAVRMSTELLGLVPVLERSPAQAFARLHTLASGSAEGGRPVGPEQADRLSGLARTLAVSRTVPALLLAAVAHAEIATVAPFGSYDGLVARAVERLVLVARGVDPASLVVPEAGHLALRAEYKSNLRGYATGHQPGLHAWLLYAAEAQARGAEASPLVG